MIQIPPCSAYPCIHSKTSWNAVPLTPLFTFAPSYFLFSHSLFLLFTFSYTPSSHPHIHFPTLSSTPPLSTSPLIPFAFCVALFLALMLSLPDLCSTSKARCSKCFLSKVLYFLRNECVPDPGNWYKPENVGIPQMWMTVCGETLRRNMSYGDPSSDHWPEIFTVFPFPQILPDPADLYLLSIPTSDSLFPDFYKVLHRCIICCLLLYLCPVLLICAQPLSLDVSGGISGSVTNLLVHVVNSVCFLPVIPRTLSSHLSHR